MVKAEPEILTYEEYLQLPETMQRYEIVDGLMHMLPAPSLQHQNIVFNLGEALRRFVRERNLGAVCVAPVDIVVQRDPLRTRQPDVLFISTQCMPSEELVKLPMLEFAPDLVVEVISTSEYGKGLSERLKDYARIGVGEVWLIHVGEGIVEVFENVEGAWKLFGLFDGDESVKSRVLEELELPVERIFAVQ